MRSQIAVAVAVALAGCGLVAASPSASAAPAPSPQVFTDTQRDVPSGIDLRRVRVSNSDQVTITTRHRSLTRRASGTFFTIYVDTRTAHPGPEFAVSGGMSRGTDWFTGRSTRNWRIYGDPVDEIGTCDSDVDLDFAADTMKVRLGRDCLGGHAGRVRVSVSVGDEKYTDYAPATKTFYGWVARRP